MKSNYCSTGATKEIPKLEKTVKISSEVTIIEPKKRIKPDIIDLTECDRPSYLPYDADN